MRNDALLQIQQQLVDVAVVAVACCGAWLLLLAVVALRHRHSPELAGRSLRRLGAPRVLVRLLVRVLVLAAGLGVVAPAHAVTHPSDVTAGSTPAGRLARALDGLPSPSLPAPGPAVHTVSTPNTPPPSAGAPVRREQQPPARTAPATHTVQPGESLWAISAAHLPRAEVDRVDRAWRRLYAANRDAVGPDPDVLAVGTALDLSPLDVP